MKYSLAFNRLFIFPLLLSVTTCLFGQSSLDYSTESPYKLNWKKETVITATGLGMLIAGDALKKSQTLFTPDELILSPDIRR